MPARLLVAALLTLGILAPWPLARGSAQAAFTVTAVVEAGRPHQTVLGFGGDFAPWHLPRLDAQDRQRLLTFIFEEMRINLVRMNNAYFEGATGQNMWGANDDPDPFHISWPALNFCTRPGEVCNDDWKTLLPQLRALGVTGGYFGNIQGPRWNGFDGSSSFSEDEMVENQLALFLHFRDHLGLAVGWVAPFSEPGGGGINWRISGVQAVNVVAKLGTRLEAAGFRGIRMIIPDAVGVENSRGYARAILADPIARRFVGAIGYHTYDTRGGGAAPDAEWVTLHARLRDLGRQYGVPLRMTEFARGSGLLQRANHIFNELEYADSQTYFPQHIISRTGGGHGASRQPESDGGAIVFATKNAAGQLVIGPTRYTGVAIGHYSRYARPGWTRLPVRSGNGAVRIQAFLSPSRSSLGIVMINNSPATASVSLSIDGGLTVEGIARAETTREGGGSFWESFGSAAYIPRSLTATLSPASVTSLMLRLGK